MILIHKINVNYELMFLNRKLAEIILKKGFKD